MSYKGLILIEEIRRYSFPLAAAINLFSITALVIIAGLFGRGELASEIAVIQGAILVVFLSLSGNARNLILSSHMKGIEAGILRFRLLTLVPAALAAFLLSTQIVETPVYLVFGLLIRKCSEWVAEIQLAHMENIQSYDQALKYCFINIVLFVLLVINLLYLDGVFFYSMLLIWSLYPIFYAARFIADNKAGADFYDVAKILMPNMGSSIVIGVSTYIFRLLIVLLAGKALAGLMISAYALGGVVSAVYTYAIGPSFMLDVASGSKKLFVSVLLCCLAGMSVVGLLWLIQPINETQMLFQYGVGFSLIGGGVMLIAQHQRLVILQVLKGDVFVPDALANILLITSIPFAFFVFGHQSLAFLFLWSATLNLAFYALLSNKHSMTVEPA